MSWATYGAAGALVARDGRLLLVRQRRPTGVWWELPVGYREADESLEETAAREVLEEAAVAVALGELACTVVWQREHDRRRNVLLYFLAAPLDPSAEPRPQLEEEIEAAAFVDPAELGDGIHPLEQPVIAGWADGRPLPFHVHADVAVDAAGGHSYRFR